MSSKELYRKDFDLKRYPTLKEYEHLVNPIISFTIATNEEKYNCSDLIFKINLSNNKVNDNYTENFSYLFETQEGIKCEFIINNYAYFSKYYDQEIIGPTFKLTKNIYSW